MAELSPRSLTAAGVNAAGYSPGGVAERLIAPVLKTGRPKGLVSSNLTPSASLVERAWEVDRITVLRNNAAEIHCCSALFAEVSIARKVHRPEGVTGGGASTASRTPPPHHDLSQTEFLGV